MMALTLSDYRIRQEICNVMAARLSDTSRTSLKCCEACLRCTAFQLALCYRLGYGIPQDHAKAIDLLAISIRPEVDLDNEIATIKHISGYGFNDLESRSAKLFDDGYLFVWDFVDEYRRKGLKLIEVEEFYLRELSEMKCLLGNDSDVVRISKIILAKIHAMRGNHGEAERLRRELLQTSLEKSGHEGRETLHAKEDLGVALLKTGRFPEAENLLSSALVGMRKTLGSNHLATLTAQAHWCETLFIHGRHEEAASNYEEIHAGFSESMGAEHTGTMTAMNNWASALGACGNFEFSKTLHSIVLDGRERVLGPKHEETLNSRTTLASALRRLGKYAEAERMHQSSLDGFEKVVRASHESVSRAVKESALTFEVLSKFQEAEAVRERGQKLVLTLQMKSKIDDDKAQACP